MHYRFLFFLLCLLGTHALFAENGWLECDYLLWTIKKAPLPIPLVTSALLDDPLPGALGQPGTKILLGNKKINRSWQNGLRIGIGEWTDSCQQFGIEGNFFILPKKTHRQSILTSGEPGASNLAVPIYDVTGLWGLDGVPGETVFILPGPLDGPGFKGRFSLKMSSKLLGFGLDARVKWISKCNFDMDFIGGFRWLQLQESLVFMGKTSALPNAPIASGFYNFKDIFKTYNTFYGPQMGLKLNYNVNRWFFKGLAKIALGCMNQKVRIKGNSQTSEGNLFYETKNTGNEVLAGGVFAEPTNHGSHYRNAFAVVCETRIDLTYKVLQCIDVNLGYNFLWLNQVRRPGKKIDRKINPTRTSLAQASRNSVGIGPDKPVPFGSSAAAPLPIGPERPTFRHRRTDFWAQGLTVSFNLKF
jgi:hypothetical protein